MQPVHCGCRLLHAACGRSTTPCAAGPAACAAVPLRTRRRHNGCPRASVQGPATRRSAAPRQWCGAASGVTATMLYGKRQRVRQAPYNAACNAIMPHAARSGAQMQPCTTWQTTRCVRACAIGVTPVPPASISTCLHAIVRSPMLNVPAVYAIRPVGPGRPQPAEWAAASAADGQQTMQRADSATQYSATARSDA